MGDNRNILGARRLSGLVLALSLGTSVAIAGDVADSLPAAQTMPTKAADAPVSMPPATDPAAATAASAVADEGGQVLPLTRAASQERIDRMSPRDWLAGYGRVVVSRPD